MNCYNHPDRPAVIQCKHCGKGFCKEEASLFENGLCPECLSKAEEQVKIDKEDAVRRDQAWYRKGLKVFLLFFIIGLALGIALFSDVEFPSNPEAGVISQFLKSRTFMVLFWGFEIGVFALCWRYSGVLLRKALTSENTGCLVSWVVWIPLKCIVTILLASIGPIFLIITIVKAYFHK